MLTVKEFGLSLSLACVCVWVWVWVCADALVHTCERMCLLNPWNFLRGWSVIVICLPCVSQQNLCREMT